MTENLFSNTSNPGSGRPVTAGGTTGVRTASLVFAAALLFRLVYVVFLNVNQVTQRRIGSILGDQFSYWRFAQAVFADPSSLLTDVSFRAPLYPLFLSLVTAVSGGGEPFIVVFVIQSFIGALSVVLIYLIALEIFDRRVAVAASLWAAVYPLYLYYCGFILGETMVTFLFLLFLYILLRHFREEKNGLMALAGLVYALLIHTDPRFLFHLPFIFLYLFVGLRKPERAMEGFGLFLAVVLVCSLPWAIRNRIVYPDRFVLINKTTLDKWAKKTIANTGQESSTRQGFSRPATVAEFEAEKEQALRRYMESGRGPTRAERASIPKFKLIASQDEVSAFRQGVRPSFSTVGLYTHHFVEFWRFARFSPAYNPYPDLRFEPVWAPRRNFLGIFFTGLLYPFLAAGLILTIRERFTLAHVASLVLLIHTALHVIVHARERYRMPLEGIVFMFSFYGLFKVLFWFNMKRGKTEAGGARRT